VQGSGRLAQNAERVRLARVWRPEQGCRCPRKHESTARGSSSSEQLIAGSRGTKHAHEQDSISSKSPLLGGMRLHAVAEGLVTEVPAALGVMRASASHVCASVCSWYVEGPPGWPGGIRDVWALPMG
jgi:hypothetical protein